MTRADGITGEEAGGEREAGKTGTTWSLFLHHVVFLLPLLQCCLPDALGRLTWSGQS